MGEQIVEINSQATVDLVHVAAQKLIKNTGLNLELTLNRSGAMETPRSSGFYCFFENIMLCTNIVRETKC